MKPIGLRPTRFRKWDIHPRNGECNWWENCTTPNKKREMKLVKKEIREESIDWEWNKKTSKDWNQTSFK